MKMKKTTEKPLTGRRILLVGRTHDEEAQMAKHFEEAGAETALLSSAKDDLRVMNEGAMHLALIDMRIDGITAMVYVMQLYARQIPVVALIDLLEEDLEEFGSRARVGLALPIDVPTDKLIQNIRMLLDSKLAARN
jgi:DNA-binding response OmpR family regulator